MNVEQTEEQAAKAFLVGASSDSSKEECERSLVELASLADTFGVEVVGSLACPVRKVDAATYLSSGKLEELSEQLAASEAKLVIFDEEISPAQQRNLEKLFSIAVMDRTELIIEIFAQRAHTKEAALQVELAKTRYGFPRLKRLWSHFSRQRASGGFLKGEGEKQIEIDKRLLKQKVQKLTEELEGVKRSRELGAKQRRRSGLPTFAIVGYTNAGKSTLLNALTDAGVFVEDKLFATLDPTTRKFTLPNGQEILLSDTVGFIRKLPHTLIAAFRSTLEVATQDDIILHVIDVSHPEADSQAATTIALLKELGANLDRVITILNKADLCTTNSMILRLRLLYPKAVAISALKREGFEQLQQWMMKELASLRKRVQLRIPQKEYALVGLLHREGKVDFENYEGDDVIIRADIPLNLCHQFDPYVEELTS